MESQQAHIFDQDSHAAGVHTGDEEQHGMTSTMRKVKAKVRKLKNTLKHGSHDHDQVHGQEHIPGQYHEEDYEDDDEEVEGDPEVHGAPRDETIAPGNVVRGAGVHAKQDVNAWQPRVNLGEAMSAEDDPNLIKDPTPTQNHSAGMDYPTEHSGSTLPGGQNAGIAPVLWSFGKMDISGANDDKIHDSPTGTHDQFGAPDLLASTHNAKIHESPPYVRESYPPSEVTKDRLHGLVPDSFGLSEHTKDDRHSRIPETFQPSETVPESLKPKNTATEGHHHRGENVSNDYVNVSPTKSARSNEPDSYTDKNRDDMDISETQPAQTTTYTGMISSAAVSAKNVVASKLGYGGGANTDTNAGTGSHALSDAHKDKDTNMSTASKPITATITDKAFSVKNAVAKKLGYRGGNTDAANIGTETTTQSTTSTAADKAAAAKDALASKLGYAGCDTTTGTDRDMTGVATNTAADNKSTTSTITDKAAAVKDVIASKLGYRGSDSTMAINTDTRVGPDTTTGNVTGAGEQANSGGVTGYGRSIASSVTGKLAPVYGAVAGAGSAVVSKIPGMGSTESDTTDTHAHTETAPVDTSEGVVKTPLFPESGIVRGKEYLSEKLKPGEDDKALSEIISGTFYKRNEEGSDKMPAAIDRVTESPEVAKRLGTDAENLGKDSSTVDNSNPSKGIADTFKGTVASWFGMGNSEKMASPNEAVHVPSIHGDAETENDGYKIVSGERRLQESNN